MHGTDPTALDALIHDVAAERRGLALPPGAAAEADAIGCGTLALLFPHFGPGGPPEAAAIAGEVVDLRARLLRFLGAQGRADRETVAEGFLAALPALRATLRRDAQAIFDADPAAESLDEVIAAYPGFRAIACHRIAHALHRLGVAILPRLIAEASHRATGIDIHPGATIGDGFAIDHGTGIVIGETTVIGDRVRIYQGVTLGALSVQKRLARTKRHPTVEDDVVIYANATILGGDTVIGAGSVIGGNVWLTRSVPPRSVVTHGAALERRREPEDDGLEFHI